MRRDAVSRVSHARPHGHTCSTPFALTVLKTGRKLPPVLPHNNVSWRHAPDVVGRRLDRTAVLVHIPSGRMFDLNETGARVWELIGRGETSDAIVQDLCSEFDVPESRARQELGDLISTLESQGLVQR